MYDESSDVMNEVKLYLDLLWENFVPALITKFYINIPVAILDHNELFVQLCPSTNLSMFDYETLAEKLNMMFRAEKDFFEHIS